MPSEEDSRDRKPLIKASEAVRLIRMGKTDLDLMEKYHISTKGLDSMFRKLVELGVIDQDELDRRKLFFQRVHEIDLVDPTDPPVPVVEINTREAVEAIRKGFTDAELIEKFSISARGLESLFRKLVQAGAITETEITLRAFSLQKSHAVELTSAGDPSSMRATISPTDAAWAIREGFSDAALMERYGISQKGLDRLFRRLVTMNKVTAEELDQRTRYFQWADQAFPRLEDSDDVRVSEPEDGKETPVRFRNRGVYAALIAGCLLGISILGLVQFFTTGSLPGLGGQAQQPRQTANPAVDVSALGDQAEDTLGMLKDILPAAGVMESAGKKQSSTAAALCQDCLQECDRLFRGKDTDRQLNRLNCKGDCLAQFRERIKRYKKTHYGDFVDHE